MAHIHFISGLPRAGWTLLSALRQKPRFEAGMSDALVCMFGALLGEMSERNELTVCINDSERQRSLRGLFNNFDQRVDTPGLHTVRLQVKAAPCKTLLPPNVAQYFANDTFWRDPMRRPKCLHIV